jgi:hypothetical protein
MRQGEVSSVRLALRGDFTNLSERKLMDCLNRLGYDIEIKGHHWWPLGSGLVFCRFGG